MHSWPLMVCDAGQRHKATDHGLHASLRFWYSGATHQGFSWTRPACVQARARQRSVFGARHLLQERNSAGARSYGPAEASAGACSPGGQPMLFYSYFKTLVGKEVGDRLPPAMLPAGSVVTLLSLR